MGKEYLQKKIENIANSLGITKKDVHNIIGWYLFIKQNELKGGRVVQIVGIVDIIPEPVKNPVASTLAFVARDIAKNTSISYNTVVTVLKYYLDEQKEQINKGNTVIYRGLVKVKPIIKDLRIQGVHSSISSKMSEEIQGLEGIQSIRVHTSKQLKNELKNKKVG